MVSYIDGSSMKSVGNQGFTVLSQNNLQHSTSKNLGTAQFLRSPFGTMFYQGFPFFCNAQN